MQNTSNGRKKTPVISFVYAYLIGENIQSKRKL